MAGVTDFGEPWRGKLFIDDGTEAYMTANRDGRALFQMRDGPHDEFPDVRTSDEMEVPRVRIVTLINLWAGVPTDLLAAHRQAGAVAKPLLVLLRDCRAALAEHDADYGFTTSAELLRRIGEILDK